MKKLKIEVIDENAVIPKYAHEGDAGLDLYSTHEAILKPGESTLIKTGIKIELPKNTEAQIRPRSGLAYRNAITVLNTPGTIDEGYRGEIGVILINHGKEDFVVEKNMRIAQMVINEIIKVDIKEVAKITSETERKSGGYGSSGVK